MKFKNIFIACGVLFFGAATLTSCGSDDTAYDIDGIAHERVYFANAGVLEEGMVVTTPVGSIVSVKGLFNVRTTKAAAKAMRVALDIDNSLVDAYNKANGTNYLAAPEGTIGMSSDGLTIPSDTVCSADTLKLTVADDKAAQLKDRRGYLVPVVIRSCDADGYRPSLNLSVRYLHIASVETVINDNAGSVPGKQVSKADAKANWKCLSASGAGLSPEGFAGLFGNGWNARWNFGRKEARSSFVVDLGAVHKLTAFTIAGQVITNTVVESSTDNSAWMTLGATKEHKSVGQWYVLYGAISARYLRVTMDLDESFWGWDYDYSSISRFNLAYDD